jgi:hypothetical protein
VETGRQAIIQEYEELESQLELIAKERSITKKELVKKLVDQPLDVIQKTRTVLKRKVQLLHYMRSWELEQAGNISLLPVSSLRRR